MPLETAFLLNPPRRRRRKSARRSRRRARRRAFAPRRRRYIRRRRRNTWVDDSKGHSRAAKKGWRRRKHRKSIVKRLKAIHSRRRSRKGRKSNPVYRTRRRYSRRHNPNGMTVAGVRLGVPEVMPGIRIPLPGIAGTIANSVVQGVIAGGIAFAGYAGSGAIANYIISAGEAAAARNLVDPNDPSKGVVNAFKGYWARPLLFTGLAAALGGVAAMAAPKSKKLLWSLLAAAGPAMRAFGGVLFAIAGGDTGIAKGGLVGDMAKLGAGLSDYLQMDGIYEAGLGEEDEDEGMEDYLQMEGVDALYEAGMGAEQEVVGI